MKNLRRVLDDETEISYFRTSAGLCLGIVQHRRNNHEDAADIYRQTIGISDAVSEMELNKVTVDDSGQTIRNRIAELKELTTKGLKKIDQVQFVPHGFSVIKQPHFRSDGSLMETIRMMELPPDPELVRRAMVGGSACDFCHKTLAELGVPRLDACSKCKMAYYCSKECQVTAWKEGHKAACRVPKDRRAGDYMRLDGLEDRKEFNNQLVCLIEQLENGRWTVEFCVPKATKFVSVTSDKLFHIRPAK